LTAIEPFSVTWVSPAVVRQSAGFAVIEKPPPVSAPLNAEPPSERAGQRGVGARGRGREQGGAGRDERAPT